MIHNESFNYEKAHHWSPLQNNSFFVREMLASYECRRILDEISIILCQPYGNQPDDLLLSGQLANRIDKGNNLMLDSLFNERQSVIAFVI